MPLYQNRVLCGAYEILVRECSEIIFRDGSTLLLYRVITTNKPYGVDIFLRAAQYSFRQNHVYWAVFDLNSLSSTISADILSLPSRDTAGVVLHTLRMAFTSAERMLAAAVQAAVQTTPIRPHSQEIP